MCKVGGIQGGGLCGTWRGGHGAPPTHLVPPAVVGRRERAHGTVSVRTRDNRQLGERDLHWVLQRLRELRDARVPDAEERF